VPVLSNSTRGACRHHGMVMILAGLLCLGCDWSIGVRGQASAMPSEVCLGGALAASGWKQATPLKVREPGPKWLQRDSPDSYHYMLFTSTDIHSKSPVQGGMSFVPASSGFDVYLELRGSGRIEDSRGPPLLARLRSLYEALRSCGGEWGAVKVNGCTNVKCGG
jgi:hypothetical protein